MIKISAITIIFTLLVALNSAQPPQTPVIGIYTQDTEQQYSTGKFSTYIAASYVKNLEMAGATVIPLFYHSTKSQLAAILPKLNGVFFPGGQMPIDVKNNWTSNTQFILEYAIQSNLNGNVFPIWATCLGYQTIMYLTSHLQDNSSTLVKVKGQDGLTCPQIVYNNDSVLLKSLTPEQYKDATTGDGIFFYHHTWAVLLQTYKKNVGLHSFWNLISTSRTIDNVQFVATVQARNYPFFMTQYHPQKNSYQWRIPALRTSNAITGAQHFINAFVSYARKNTNEFPLEQLNKRRIFNYNPKLTSLDYAFMQIYIFDQDKEIKKFEEYAKTE